MASSWEFLKNYTVAGSATSTMDTGAFTAKKYLRVVIYGKATSGSDDGLVRFNGNSDAVYGRNYRTNSLSNGSNGSLTSMNNVWASEAGRDPFFSEFTISNVLANEKLVVGKMIFCEDETGAGSADVPSRRVCTGKWAKTDQQITSVQCLMASDTYAIGSSITVWGADDAPLVYPNLENGTIFITSDTNVHYMWNSSAETWNEVA